MHHEGDNTWLPNIMKGTAGPHPHNRTPAVRGKPHDGPHAMMLGLYIGLAPWPLSFSSKGHRFIMFLKVFRYFHILQTISPSLNPFLNLKTFVLSQKSHFLLLKINLILQGLGLRLGAIILHSFGKILVNKACWTLIYYKYHYFVF